MGREIRRVPPDWEHPTQDCPHSPWMGGCEDARQNGGRCRHPLYDRSFREAVAEWKAGYAAWESGADPQHTEHPEYEYWEWDGGPPERVYYRPDWPEGAATAYQMYETVSEGTPVSPVFTTREAMATWLVTDQGWSKRAAADFTEHGWAPSAIFVSDRGLLSAGDGGASDELARTRASGPPEGEQQP